MRNNRAEGITSGSERKTAGAFRNMAAQFVILLLCQTGFLYSLISVYGISLSGIGLAAAETAFCILFIFVFSGTYYFALAAVFFALAGVWIWFRSDELVQSWLLLLQTAIGAAGLPIPGFIDKLLVPETANFQYALLNIAYFSTMISACGFVRKMKISGIVLATVPALIPALIYQLPFETLPFFMLFGGMFLFVLYRRFLRNENSVMEESDIPIRAGKKAGGRFSASAAAAATGLLLFTAVFFISGLILPEKDYVRNDPLEKIRDSLYESKLGDLLGRPNNGLMHGNFRELSQIRFDGSPELKVRVSDRVSLYLKDYIGTVYSEEGWKTVPDGSYSAADGKDPDVIPQFFHSKTQADGNGNEPLYTLSVKSGKHGMDNLLIPAGIVSEPRGDAPVEAQNDTGFRASDGTIGQYTLNARDIRSALSSIDVRKGDGDFSRIQNSYMYAAKKRYSKTKIWEPASAYIDYVFDWYTDLPDEVREKGTQLVNRFGLTAGLKSGSLNLAQICRDVQQLLASECSYSYDPPEIPANEDFSSYFLLSSRKGYCIHFATAAVVLLRSMGIPARYAEGYIVVRTDYDKETDAEGYISIEDTHAHAWAEVFDPVQLEWIPVEMTPNADEDSANRNGNDEPSPTPDLTESPEPDSAPQENSEEPVPEEDPDMQADENEETGDEMQEDTDPQEDTDEQGQEEASGGEEEETDLENPESTPELGEMAGDLTENGGSSDEVPVSLESDSTRLSALWVIWTALGCLIAAGVVFLRRKYRRARYDRAAVSGAVLMKFRELNDILRVCGLRDLTEIQNAESYSEKIASVVSSMDPVLIRRIYQLAERAEFYDASLTAADRTEMENDVELIRRNVFRKAGFLRKLGLLLWYS